MGKVKEVKKEMSLYLGEMKLRGSEVLELETIFYLNNIYARVAILVNESYGSEVLRWKDFDLFEVK